MFHPSVSDGLDDGPQYIKSKQTPIESAPQSIKPIQTPIQSALQTLHYHKQVLGTDELDKACGIGIDLAVSVLTTLLPQEQQMLADKNADIDVLDEMYGDLRLEAGEWIEIKEGCKLPDYDEYVLWAFEDGTFLWDALDKDGSPWLLNGGEVEGFPMKQATHYRKIMTPSDCDATFNMK